ncbi:MAG: uracil phosphoribosyltransferase, partial [Selenomonas sp.]|nr:uracil phosphoribosyltransferase [Selenomonas sp.]
MADTFRPSDIPTLHLVDHPLIQHKLTIMRRKETGTKEF